ncbi:hypothetical protein [Clostridium sp. BSD9I1]|uniref:hypothetical protein n=1 Tax=Clostridium sp. BSD9I1 TaxID=2003589 RepID=UPI00164516DA|nr:hypothetical protein [Clostridium sp. BSD9I1]
MLTHRLLDLSKFPDCSVLSENGKSTRLSNLDSSTQKHIAEKYYGGSMPWNGKISLRSYSGYERLKSSKYKIKNNI